MTGLSGISILVLNHKATELLQAGGLKVGLMGVKMSAFDKMQPVGGGGGGSREPGLYEQDKATLFL